MKRKSSKIYIYLHIFKINKCINKYTKFSESGKKEDKKKIHEEIIAEDYDNAKDDINQIDISQKFMVIVTKKFKKKCVKSLK